MPIGSLIEAKSDMFRSNYSSGLSDIEPNSSLLNSQSKRPDIQ
jgi:hypothetical protein